MLLIKDKLNHGNYHRAYQIEDKGGLVDEEAA